MEDAQLRERSERLLAGLGIAPDSGKAKLVREHMDELVEPLVARIADLQFVVEQLDEAIAVAMSSTPATSRPVK